jgi:hypothetical protein
MLGRGASYVYGHSFAVFPETPEGRWEDAPQTRHKSLVIENNVRLQNVLELLTPKGS